VSCLLAVLSNRPGGVRSDDHAQHVHERAQAEVPLAQNASNLIGHETLGGHPVPQRKGLAADAEQQMSLQIPRTWAQAPFIRVLQAAQLFLGRNVRWIQRVEVVAELA